MKRLAGVDDQARTYKLGDRQWLREAAGGGGRLSDEEERRHYICILSERVLAMDGACCCPTPIWSLLGAAQRKNDAAKKGESENAPPCNTEIDRERERERERERGYWKVLKDSLVY